jgi:flagellar motor switch protein FliN/FliY
VALRSPIRKRQAASFACSDWPCLGALRLSQVKAVNVEIQVVLGRSTLPMQQLLRMGRGAVIPLDATANEEVWILANNHPVARGEIQINEDRISIAVTREADVYDYMAGGA